MSKRDGTYAHTRTTTIYNLANNPTGTGYVANYMPRTVLEEGYIGTGNTGDERCTRTSYVNNIVLASTACRSHRPRCRAATAWLAVPSATILISSIGWWRVGREGDGDGD